MRLLGGTILGVFITWATYRMWGPEPRVVLQKVEVPVYKEVPTTCPTQNYKDLLSFQEKYMDLTMERDALERRIDNLSYENDDIRRQLYDCEYNNND